MRVAQVGWAEVEITPPLGLPMGGRGPRFTPGAAVLDPLMAQATILQDAEGQRTLWVSVDLIGFTSEFSTALRYEMAALTGVPYEAVVISQAHPHSGPMINFDKYPSVLPKPAGLAAYEQELRRALPRLAYRAAQKLRPATITLYKGRSEVGINRRNRNEAGEMTMAPNANGVANPDLWVFDVRAVDSQPHGEDGPTGGEGGRCVLFNYGCHPVIVYGYAWDGISADYPGECRKRLKETLGQGVHCQFLQGLAGNVRPRVLADLTGGRFRKATPEDLVAAGGQLASDVLGAMGGEGETLDLDIAAAAGWFLAKRDVAAVPPLEHWQALAEQEDELSGHLGRYWVGRLQAGLPAAQAVPWPVGLVRLDGRHRIAWLGGEVVAEWQGHLRRWLEDERLMVWGYSQEVPSYLPTDELLPEGGYEVVQSNLYSTEGPVPFVKGLNEAVKRRFLALAKQL